MSANETTLIEDEQDTSEFGAGLVVCLAKFTEHLWNRWENTLHDTVRWQTMSEGEREQKRAEAVRYPHGDAARFLSNARIYGDRSPEDAVSSQIELWMNGASDHFYDLDRAKAPPSLVALADLTLRIGHGFTPEKWTMEHVERIRDLWRKSCLELDEMLGTKPDWGQW